MTIKVKAPLPSEARCGGRAQVDVSKAAGQAEFYIDGTSSGTMLDALD
jgi:hypothetical protein